MTPAEVKERILLLLEPHVDAIAGELAELVPSLLRERLAAVLETASLQLEAPKAVTKSKPAIATPAKSTAKAASSSSGLTSKGTPRQRIGSCGKCGEVGKRSDSCGITHNLKSKKTSASKIVMRPAPAVVATPDTPPPTRSDRYSAIELANAERRIAERDQRSAARVDTGARPARGVSRAQRTDLEPEDVIGLPIPIATFDF